MLQALALAGLSAAGSFMSSKGAGAAAAKQGRLQMMEDYRNQARNDQLLSLVNEQRTGLGRELLGIQETHDVEAESGSWVDVDGMMAAAERAGFNPVTFLNAGGMAAYTQGWTRNRTTLTGQNASDAFKMMLPEYALSSPSQVPAQSNNLQAFGGALSAGASAFGTQLRADQSYDVQMARLMASGAMQGMGLSQGGANGLSRVVSYGGNSGLAAGYATPAQGLSQNATLSDLPYPTKWKQGDVDVTNPWSRLFIDSTAPDAEMGEQRYGDIAQELFGAANFVQDAIRNVFGTSTRDMGRVVGINIGEFHHRPNAGDRLVSVGFL